jgi:protein AaeX
MTMLEIDFGGVFLPAALVWAGAAFIFNGAAQRALSRTTFYDLVWHRGLFDFAVFVILWGAISAGFYYAAFSSAFPG